MCCGVDNLHGKEAFISQLQIRAVYSTVEIGLRYLVIPTTLATITDADEPLLAAKTIS